MKQIFAVLHAGIAFMAVAHVVKILARRLNISRVEILRPDGLVSNQIAELLHPLLKLRTSAQVHPLTP